MKALKDLIFCLSLCLSTTNTFGQFECGSAENQTAQTASAITNNCFSTSEFNYNFDASYIPDSDSDILTVKYNVHIMQFDAADLRNYDQNDPDDVDYLINMLNRMELVFDNVLAPIYEGQTNPSGFSTISDARIRFERQNIYYRIDPIGWDNDVNSPNDFICGNYNYINYAQNSDCELNIFLTGSNVGRGDGCYGSAGLAGEENYYINNKSWNFKETREWWTQGYGLAHEVAHAFGLWHIWDRCNDHPDIYCPHQDEHCGKSENDCSNNIMGYSGEQLHISPTQAGHMRELLLNTWRSKSLNMDFDASQSINITSNETWSFARAIRGDITIKTGNILTIECRLLMAPNAKVIVEKGAQLIVNGGIITTKANECGGRQLWGGIEVRGDPNLAQTTANQGQVVLNNARIEYANEGVMLHWNAWGNTGGGIIEADDTEFYNNKRAVSYVPYANDNVSFFNNCTFEIDDNLPTSSYIGMMTMWDVRGVDITNCIFRNSNSLITDRKYGIYTIDAGFNVTSGTIFEGFIGGIYATNSSSTNFFTVNAGIFNDNAVGIYAGSVDNLIVTDNTLNVSGYETNDFEHGIYIDRCTGFQVEGNTIDGIGAGNPDIATGIECYQTGNNANEINGNILSSLEHGLKATGDNRDDTFPFGLEFLCNELSVIEDADIIAVIDNTYPSSHSGISPWQGEQLKSAGNIFHYGGNFNFKNETNYGVLYWKDNFSGRTPIVTQNVTVQTAVTANGCASQVMMMASGNESLNLNQLNSNQNLLAAAKNDYQQQIDGGNTTDLLDKINRLDKSNATEVLDELTSLSPWLSSTVIDQLLSVDEKIISKEALRSLLIQNPDATRKISHNALASKLAPISLQQVKAETNTLVTARTDLESEIRDYAKAVHQAASWLIKSEVQKTTPDLDKVRTYLSAKGTKTAKFAIVESWLQEKNASQALNELNRIIKASDPADREDYNEYYKLTKLKTDAIQSGRTLAEFTKSEIDLLESIANADRGRAGVQAKGILNFFYGYNYGPKIINSSGTISEAQWVENRSQNTPSSVLPIQSEYLTIYPNPTQTQLYFKFDPKLELPERSVLRVYAQDGREVKSFMVTGRETQIAWDVSDLYRGVYVFQLISDDGILQGGRFLIVD